MTTTDKRNILGCIGWLILTILFTAFITEPLMIWREYRQSKQGGFPVEQDDIAMYSIVILAGQMIQIGILASIIN